MGQPSPSRRRVPQACDRCRVKKGKCDGKKPVCTRCALDGQMCMFSERKFSKDRVIPKGYWSKLARLTVIDMSNYLRTESTYSKLVYGKHYFVSIPREAFNYLTPPLAILLHRHRSTFSIILMTSITTSLKRSKNCNQ